ncbi:hypothetical protein [Fulvivirga sediminis]|uniref:Uncharacterized protein n=1 Tax=Fulvivirga sediminis TaxID=2803949 RepID=A0A937F3T3_9BACT|nr:hypothetical protein [Fulvivirga sediminis]MBL3654496.1 hypothetical protein [Fulvivirga sediminis]
MIFICYGSLASGQTKEEHIQNLRSEFQRVNSITDLKEIVIDSEDFLDHVTDGGGELKGYFENADLVKFTERIGLSYGVRVTDYYSKAGRIFFSYRIESRFDDKYDDSGELTGLNYSKLILKYEGRYYFNNGKLIEIIEKVEPMFSSPFEANSFLKVGHELKELLVKAK